MCVCSSVHSGVFVTDLNCCVFCGSEFRSYVCFCGNIVASDLFVCGSVRVYSRCAFCLSNKRKRIHHVLADSFSLVNSPFWPYKEMAD